MSNPNAASESKSRTVRLIRPPCAVAPGKLSITETKGRKTETTVYFVTCMDSDMGGACYQLAKVGQEQQDGATVYGVAEKYNVRLAGPDSSCDCPWGTYGAQKKPCRHVAALLVLAGLGKLDAPAPVCQPAHEEREAALNEAEWA